MHARNMSGIFAFPRRDKLAMTGLIFADFVNVRPNIKLFQAAVNC